LESLSQRDYVTQPSVAATQSGYAGSQNKEAINAESVASKGARKDATLSGLGNILWNIDPG
jgi:hypothetical protein